MEKEVFFVERVIRWGVTDDQVFEISLSEGYANFNEDAHKEGYESRYVYEEFERTDYLSTKIIINGKIISDEDFDEMGGFNAYDRWKWDEDEYFENYNDALEFEKKLIKETLSM